jgi:hypothetical protein
VNVIGRTSPNYFEAHEFTVAIERKMLDRELYRARFVSDDSTLLESVAVELEDNIDAAE